MGKTVESYRIALEEEINRWNGFARALRKDDREAFEELMDMCRSFASESSNATNPVIFEPMVMSILLAHREKDCGNLRLQPITRCCGKKSASQEKPIQTALQCQSEKHHPR